MSPTLSHSSPSPLDLPGPRPPRYRGSGSADGAMVSLGEEQLWGDVGLSPQGSWCWCHHRSPGEQEGSPEGRAQGSTGLSLCPALVSLGKCRASVSPPAKGFVFWWRLSQSIPVVLGSGSPLLGGGRSGGTHGAGDVPSPPYQWSLHSGVIPRLLLQNQTTLPHPNLVLSPLSKPRGHWRSL